jgi:hypothetical protein
MKSRKIKYFDEVALDPVSNVTLPFTTQVRFISGEQIGQHSAIPGS